MRRDHIDDDYLELYALDRLAEPDAARVEEHLLVCGECRMRLAASDAYVAAMGAACRAFRDGVSRRNRDRTNPVRSGRRVAD